MTNTFQNFEAHVLLLNQKMKEWYKQNEPGKAFVLDGIVNNKEYFNSSLKIMWILKEPYSGSIGYINDLDKKRAAGEKKDSQNTWNPIAFISYSLLNNFKDIKELNEIKTNKSINESLRKISIINVQKTEAGTQSKAPEILAAYSRHYKILLQQINTYNPSIIINCSGIKSFAEDMKFTTSIGFGHYANDTQVIINTFHPQQMKIKKIDYINKIVLRIKDWYTNTNIHNSKLITK